MRLPIAKIALILGMFVIFPGILVKPGSSQQQRVEATQGLDAEMVALHVTVLNRQDQRIIELKKEDFRIFEDGVEQEIVSFNIADEPIMVALLLDTSGSVRTDLMKIKDAAIDFVNHLHSKDAVSILTFSDDARILQPFSVDRVKTVDRIKQISSGNSTALYEMIAAVLKKTIEPIPGRKALVILSDGMDTRSHITKEETFNLAKGTWATIYCVYTKNNVDQVIWPGVEYLKKLSEYSGGSIFDGTKDLRNAFAQLVNELSSQYRIGYYSTNDKRNGKFRKVEVKMARSDLIARTIKGYYAKRTDR